VTVNETLVMTFKIKKRINTEMFIDRMPALYVGVANEADQSDALGD